MKIPFQDRRCWMLMPLFTIGFNEFIFFSFSVLLFCVKFLVWFIPLFKQCTTTTRTGVSLFWKYFLNMHEVNACAKCSWKSTRKNLSGKWRWTLIQLCIIIFHFGFSGACFGICFSFAAHNTHIHNSFKNELQLIWRWWLVVSVLVVVFPFLSPKIYCTYTCITRLICKFKFSSFRYLHSFNLTVDAALWFIWKWIQNSESQTGTNICSTVEKKEKNEMKTK